MILAIDPAIQTGWAIQGKSGTIRFAADPRQQTYQRVQKFRDWLLLTIKEHKIEFIIYEKPTAGHFAATRSHAHFEAVILLVCFDLGLGFNGVSAASLKKFATNKGNSSKSAMMAAYKAKYNTNPIDDNECDARFLLDYFFSFQS